MKSTDKLTKEIAVKLATKYAINQKSDYVVYYCETCGWDFEPKKLAEFNKREGVLIEYSKKEITITYEDKTVEKVKVDLPEIKTQETEKEETIEAPVEIKSVKAKTTDKQKKVHNKE